MVVLKDQLGVRVVHFGKGGSFSFLLDIETNFWQFEGDLSGTDWPCLGQRGRKGSQV